MTLRLESERMFVSVLAAAVLHALLLAVVHKLLDLDHRLDTRPLTVHLIGPVVREATGQERAQPVPPSAPKRAQAPAPVVAERPVSRPVVEKAAPAPVVAERPVSRPVVEKAAPAPVVAERPAPRPVVEKAAPAPVVAERPAPRPVVEKAAPAPVVAERPAPRPVVEKAAPAPVVAERPAPQPLVTGRPAPQPLVTERPAPQAVVTAKPAPALQPAQVDPQARAETDAPAAPVQQSWTATMRKEFDAAQVRGRAGLNARASAAGESAAVTVPFAGPAVPAGAAVSQGALAASFKEGIARPADESVYAKSASSPMPNAQSARDAGSDSAVPVVRDPELAGPSREVVASAPVRMSGTPTASSGDAAGSGTGSPARSSMPISYPSPGPAKPAPVGATVYGGAPAPAAESPSVGSRIGDLDRALDSGARGAAGSGGGDGSGSQGEGAAGGPAGRDPRLPEGWNVSGSLGLRPLLNVIHPALPDRYPDEIVQMTVRVLIRVDPAGWVRVERFEQDSGSTELNNEITKTLRQWRYEPVDDRDPAYGVVTIQIRSRSN